MIPFWKFLIRLTVWPWLLGFNSLIFGAVMLVINMDPRLQVFEYIMVFGFILAFILSYWGKAYSDWKLYNEVQELKRTRAYK